MYNVIAKTPHYFWGGLPLEREYIQHILSPTDSNEEDNDPESRNIRAIRYNHQEVQYTWYTESQVYLSPIYWAGSVE